MLFTDGISNFGSEEPARLDAPLYIFSADAGANHALLHSLAMSNGGRYFNLANWKDADIFAQAGKPAWSFLVDKDRRRGGGGPLSAAAAAAGRPLHAGGQAHRRDGHGHGRLRPRRRKARQTDLQGLAVRGRQRLALAAALGGQETGRADDPPEAERARDRRLGQEVQPGHALHVALGARLAGAIRPLRHRPAQVAARDAGRVHAADRHHRAPEAEGEGRQGRRGGPHVAGAGQLVDQRVQVSQGLSSMRARGIRRNGWGCRRQGKAAAGADSTDGAARAARHHSVVCRPRGGAGAGTAIRAHSPAGDHLGKPARRHRQWIAGLRYLRRPGPYRETSRNEPAFLAASPASSSSRGTPTRPI